MPRSKGLFFGLVHFKNFQTDSDKKLQARLHDAPGLISVERQNFGIFSKYEIRTKEPQHPYYQNLKEFDGICIKIVGVSP